MSGEMVSSMQKSVGVSGPKKVTKPGKQVTRGQTKVPLSMLPNKPGSGPRNSTAAEELKQLFTEMGLPGEIVPDNVKSYKYIRSSGDLNIQLQSVDRKVLYKKNTIIFRNNIHGRLKNGDFNRIKGIMWGIASVVNITQDKPGFVKITGKLGYFSKTLILKEGSKLQVQSVTTGQNGKKQEGLQHSGHYMVQRGDSLGKKATGPSRLGDALAKGKPVESPTVALKPQAMAAHQSDKSEALKAPFHNKRPHSINQLNRQGKSLNDKSYELQQPVPKTDTTPLMTSEKETIAKEGFSGTTGSVPYKAEMESAFGVSLDNVKAHTGKAATQASKALGAEAYTYGTDIVFRDARPSRSTVAHEVKHVIQQAEGSMASEHGQEAEANQAESLIRSTPSAHIKPEPLQLSGKRYLRFKIKEEITKDELLGSQTGTKKEIPPAKIPGAISYNNKRWQGRLRFELLGFLRGTTVPEGAEFTEEDVKKVAMLQDAAGIDVDGKIGSKTMAVFLHVGLKFSEEVAAARQGTVKLIFYPGELEALQKWEKLHQLYKDDWREMLREGRLSEGEGRLYVKVGGRIVSKYKARGGPPLKFKDEKHTAGPTPAGIYRLGAKHHHTTRSWAWSEIPWGSELRYPGNSKVEYKPPGSQRWKIATKLKKEHIAKRIGKGQELPKIYQFNDFGEWAWNLKRGKSRTAYYLHTTPHSEEVKVGDDLELATSHGCIHLDPRERDEMIKRGYLRRGVILIVKQYTAHLLSGKVRELLNNQGPGKE